MSITVNIYYTGINGNARKFAEEMVTSGIVDAIKNNPMFSVLSENKEYKFLIEKLSLLEE